MLNWTLIEYPAGSSMRLLHSLYAKTTSIFDRSPSEKEKVQLFGWSWNLYCIELLHNWFALESHDQREKVDRCGHDRIELNAAIIIDNRHPLDVGEARRKAPSVSQIGSMSLWSEILKIFFYIFLFCVPHFHFSRLSLSRRLQQQQQHSTGELESESKGNRRNVTCILCLSSSRFFFFARWNSTKLSGWLDACASEAKLKLLQLSHKWIILSKVEEEKLSILLSSPPESLSIEFEIQSKSLALCARTHADKKSAAIATRFDFWRM